MVKSSGCDFFRFGSGFDEDRMSLLVCLVIEKVSPFLVVAEKLFLVRDYLHVFMG